MSAQLLETRTSGPTEIERGHRKRSRAFGGSTGFAVGAIALHALLSWVVLVTGDTSLLRRSLLLGVVGLFILAAVFVDGRSSQHLRAWVSLLFGVVCLTVLAPIVGSRVAKIGTDVIVLSGAAALAGATTLVVVGAKGLVRLAATWPRKLLAIPVAFVLLQFLVLPLAGAAYTTNAARPPLGDRTPADLGLSYEDVLITSADGTENAAWYLASDNGSAIILRHGSGSTRSATLEHLGFLAEAGYGVLTMDARGHGRSDGRINESGWHGPQDISAAVDYLTTRSDVTGSIGILGLSMGGEEAIHAAAVDSRIAAVVAEGIGIGNYEDSIVRDPGPVGRFVNWTQFSMIEVLSDAAQPRGIVETIADIEPRPVLLIIGDESVEQEMGPLYEKAAGPSTVLWNLRDTPHTSGLRSHPSEYKQRVLEIFDNTL